MADTFRLYALYMFCSAALFLSSFSRSAAEEPQILISVTGKLETIFQTTVPCNSDDIPDGPLRVFRRSDGREIGFAPHFNNLSFYIENGSFIRNCTSSFVGAQSGDEDKYNDRGWITATWATGRHVLAIIHNEYWGQTHPGKCFFRDYLKCWSNAMTIAESFDDGRSFQIARHHVLAAGDLHLSDTQGARYGYSNSSNLLEHDGYYYLAAEMIGVGGAYMGACLMRSDKIEAASHWRGWDGNSFSAPLVGPINCKPFPHLSGVMGSIVEHNKMFIAVTLAPTGASPAGVYYTTSANLIDWTAPRLLLAATPSWSKRCVDGELRVNFPSIIDLSATRTNFDQVGNEAQLFLVGGSSFLEGNYCKQINKRLVAVKLSISP